MVDPAERREVIQQQVTRAAETINGHAMISPDLLAEVTHLVEWPTAVVGQFDAEFLELPPEVAIIEMESHQRYFPSQGNGRCGYPTALLYYHFQWRSG